MRPLFQFCQNFGISHLIDYRGTNNNFAYTENRNLESQYAIIVKIFKEDCQDETDINEYMGKG